MNMYSAKQVLGGSITWRPILSHTYTEHLRERSWQFQFAFVSVDAWHSKEVSPLSFPPDTLRLSNKTDDMRKSQNTVPLKPFGCWQGPRRWLTCAAFREQGRVLVMSHNLSLSKVRNNREKTAAADALSELSEYSVNTVSALMLDV